MNIRSVTTPAATQPSQPAAPSTSDTPATAAEQSSSTTDSYQPAQNERMVNMLQEQSDVRPDALERAKSLAADPNYPGTGTIEGLAKLLIANGGEE